MRDQFDISGVFETTEFEIAQVACTSKRRLAFEMVFGMLSVENMFGVSIHHFASCRQTYHVLRVTGKIFSYTFLR